MLYAVYIGIAEELRLELLITQIRRPKFNCLMVDGLRGKRYLLEKAREVIFGECGKSNATSLDDK